MDGGVDHLPFVNGAVARRGIAEVRISDEGTVGNGGLLDITAGESHDGGEGVVLVRNGKIGIMSKFFVTGGTLPSDEKTKNSLYELVDNNLKVPAAGLVAFKPGGRGITTGARWQGADNLAPAHVIAVLLDLLNSDGFNKGLETAGGLVIMHDSSLFWVIRIRIELFALSIKKLPKKAFLCKIAR